MVKFNPRVWASPDDMARVLSRGPQEMIHEVKRRIRAHDPKETPFMDTFERGPYKDWDAWPRLKRPSMYSYNDVLLRRDNNANWWGVDYRLQLFAGAMLDYFDTRQVPLFVHTALRGKLAQDAAFAAGNSKLKWPNGAHNRGGAIDLVHAHYAWNMIRDEWSAIGAVGKMLWVKINIKLPSKDKIDLEWGGDWNFYDPAHWQIANYRALPPVREAHIEDDPAETKRARGFLIKMARNVLDQRGDDDIKR